MNTTDTASVALVKAKIEKTRRDKEEASARRAAEQKAYREDYIEFWGPLISTLRELESAFPDDIRVIETPPTSDSFYYRCEIKNRVFGFGRNDGHARMQDILSDLRSNGVVAYNATNGAELIPKVLEFIARRLS